MHLILNTVRLMENDQAKEYALGDINSLEEKLALAFINPLDFKELNLDNNPNLKIFSKFGNIIVKALKDEDVPKGSILMPISIWSNQITGIENSELLFKNIDVTVEATDTEVINFDSIIQRIKEG